MADYDVNEPKSRIQETVEGAKEKTKEATEQMKQEATQRARSLFTNQRNRAAERLEGVASAFRETGSHLREQHHQTVANYTEEIAAQVERFSGYIRERDVDQIVSEIENLARRQPPLFLGSTFAMGFLLARFLKSSGVQEARWSRPQIGSESTLPEETREGLGGESGPMLP